MTDRPSSRLLDTASMLTEGCATCIWPYYGKLDASQIKAKGERRTASGAMESDKTTIADEGMGEFVIAASATQRPDREILNEETRKKQANMLDRLGLGKWSVLDDLDGTEWFAKGKLGDTGEPDFGVLFNDIDDGATTAAWVLCTTRAPGGGLDREMTMGDAESGVWHSPAIGQPFVRVLPFVERSPKPEDEKPRGVISARYLLPELFRTPDLFRKDWKDNDVIPHPVLDLRESASAVRLWTDMVLGKVDFTALGPTRPWDQNAGGFLTQLLGGEARAMDTWKHYVPWRYDGGIIAASSPEMLERAANDLFVTGAGPTGREPCVWDLLLQPTKDRLLAGMAGSTIVDRPKEPSI